MATKVAFDEATMLVDPEELDKALKNAKLTSAITSPKERALHVASKTGKGVVIKSRSFGDISIFLMPDHELSSKPEIVVTRRAQDKAIEAVIALLSGEDPRRGRSKSAGGAVKASEAPEAPEAEENSAKGESQPSKAPAKGKGKKSVLRAKAKTASA